jgi:hypothetical protein
MTTTAALCFWAMAVNRFFSSVTRIVRDHIIRRRPVAGEDDHCSGDRQQSPKDFLSAAYVRRRKCAASRQPRLLLSHFSVCLPYLRMISTSPLQRAGQHERIQASKRIISTGDFYENAI